MDERHSSGSYSKQAPREERDEQNKKIIRLYLVVEFDLLQQMRMERITGSHIGSTLLISIPPIRRPIERGEVSGLSPDASKRV